MKSGQQQSRLAIDWSAVRERLARNAAAAEQALRLSPQRAAEVLADRARRLARPPAAADAGERLQAVVFVLAGARYALETRHIREVVPLGACTPLPGTPDFLVGLMNLRGALLVVFDLARLFGLAGAARGEAARVLVLGGEQPEFGIVADAVEEVAVLPVAEFRPMPEGGAGGQPFCRAVAPGALVVLDGALLLADDRLCIDQRPDA